MSPYISSVYCSERTEFTDFSTAIASCILKSGNESSNFVLFQNCYGGLPSHMNFRIILWLSCQKACWDWKEILWTYRWNWGTDKNRGVIFMDWKTMSSGLISLISNFAVFSIHVWNIILLYWSISFGVGGEDAVSSFVSGFLQLFRSSDFFH